MRTRTYPIVFAFLVLLSSCVSQSSTETISVTTTPSPERAMVTATFVPTPVPAFTNTPVPTKPLSATPTALVDDVAYYLKELLKNEGDCVLPCWLGITPGLSTMQDFQSQTEIFSSLATDAYVKPAKGKWVGRLEMQTQYPADGLTVDIWTAAISNSSAGAIEFLTVYSRAYIDSHDVIEWQYADDRYTEYLQAYSLTEMLRRYGPPSNIYLTAQIRFPGTDGHLSPRDTFELRLLYPETGIFVTYMMRVVEHGNNYRFCPDASLIDLDLISPSQSGNYQEIMAERNDWEGFFPPSQYNKTLEGALGITIDGFYQLILAQADRCFETPKSIWPEH